MTLVNIFGELNMPFVCFSYRLGKALRPPASVSPSLQTRRATSE
jgi:hypothetical protein